MRRKYIIFIITLLLFCILFNVFKYIFFDDEDGKYKVSYDNGVYSGISEIQVKRDEKGYLLSNLSDVNALCVKLFNCRAEKKSETQSDILIIYDFLEQAIKVNGSLDIVSLNDKNYIEYQFVGLVDSMQNDEITSAYPINVYVKFSFSEKDFIKITWKVESPLILKVVNRLGESIVTFGIKNIQSTLLKTILFKEDLK